MATISAEAVLARFAELESRCNDLMQRLNASEQQHGVAHQQLEAAKITIRGLQNEVANAGTGKGGFRLIDPKSMVPERLGNGNQWRGWADASRSYIENLDVNLAKWLKQVEGRSEPLQEEEITGANIPEGHVAQLNRYLKLRTAPDSHPNTMIKAAQSEYLHPLEQWRRLSYEYDPKGLGSEFVEMQELMSPERLRAKNLSGVSAAVEAWEELERRHKARHGLALPEPCRIAVLFKLIPEKLGDEILRFNTKWDSYTKLKEHLHSLQFNRTSGHAPMLQNVEEELAGEALDTEDGELMRLEKRDGKKVLVRVPPPPSVPAGGERKTSRRPQGNGNWKSKVDCYRCGRIGHLGRECTERTHIDGGKPKPPPRPRLAGSLEENSPGSVSSVDTAPEVHDLSTISVCALEDLGGVVEEADQEEDPWENGADPWGADHHHSDVVEAFGLKSEDQTPPFPFGTLKSLFASTKKCEICAAQGVYNMVEETIKHEKYFIPTSMSPIANFEAAPVRAIPSPKVPMPTWVPASNQLWLSHCVPEVPEPEVLEWDTPADGEVDESSANEDCDDQAPVIDPPSSTAIKILEGSDDLVVDLNAVTPAQDLLKVEASGKELIEITVDSGAGAPVCDPSHFPESIVEDSPGSLSGQIFSGPGGEKIPNQGQLQASARLENGNKGNFLFQAAAVRKPLLAVSSVNDKGNLVLFDNEGSYIIPSHNKDLLTKLRQLVKQMTGKIALHRKNGVYNMKAWRSKPAFVRQGR